MSKSEAGFLERFGTGIDAVRKWGVMVFRLGSLMAKGAFLISERKRLFLKLGESAYRSAHQKETASDVTTIVDQIDRLTRKLELEERIIRSVRFGSRAARTAGRNNSNPGSNSGPSASTAAATGPKLEDNK